MIGRRRPQPQPEPAVERVSFTARPRVSAVRDAVSRDPVSALRADALEEASEFFGPGFDLQITGPWTASRGADDYGYCAEITVTATPRSTK